ncbi:hypothetical protein OW763_14295 [Clostridium aestuarii]|uniref:Uncharacterized protein n=1 Tax=Clostridium aestuarii TaxID=338193 RepID=A0ABT4D2M2_9CLOT|nr:hypothetical protein [Clostridium aestuarii]MCY6485501.1 hypothetical protein [Clostridium aestuarii]
MWRYNVFNYYTMYQRQLEYTIQLKYIDAFTKYMSKLKRQMYQIDEDIDVLKSNLDSAKYDQEDTVEAMIFSGKDLSKVEELKFKVDKFCELVQYFDTIGRILMEKFPLLQQGFFPQIMQLKPACKRFKKEVQQMLGGSTAIFTIKEKELQEQEEIIASETVDILT